MTSEFVKAAALIVAIASVPLLVWLGAYLTRAGTAFGRFVDRHFRAIGVALLVVKMVSSVLEPENGWSAARAVGLVSFGLLAMLFVPFLRRFEKSTDTAFRDRSA